MASCPTERAEGRQSLQDAALRGRRGPLSSAFPRALRGPCPQLQPGPWGADTNPSPSSLSLSCSCGLAWTRPWWAWGKALPGAKRAPQTRTQLGRPEPEKPATAWPRAVCLPSPGGTGLLPGVCCPPPPCPQAGAQLVWSAGNRCVWVSLVQPHSRLQRSDLRPGLDPSASRAPPSGSRGPTQGLESGPEGLSLVGMGTAHRITLRQWLLTSGLDRPALGSTAKGLGHTSSGRAAPASGAPCPGRPADASG